MSHAVLFNELKLQRDYLLGLLTRQSITAIYPAPGELSELYPDDRSEEAMKEARRIRTQLLATASQITGSGHMGTPVEEIRSYGANPLREGR